MLEQGAIALALGRLAAGGADEWASLASRRLLESLIDGRFATAADAQARLEAAGLPMAGRLVVGLVAAGVNAAGVERAAAGIGGVARAWDREGLGAVGLLSLPSSRELDAAAAGQLLDAAGGGSAATLTLGRLASGVDEALASLRDALDHVGDRADGRVRWANARPLARLMNALRDDHRLLEHGERMLAPLIAFDERNDGDLVRVLDAMLTHPGNRTAAARAALLSRSVFYQRLALIAELLDVDLDDGETQTALHVAVMARRG